MIRMIFEICKDMAAFSFVLALAMIAFGNTLYILAVNGLKTGAVDPLFTGPTFIHALIYSFRLGLGDFSTDSYDDAKNKGLIWFIFLFEAILI
jgi:hypothetical protein